MAFIIPRKAVRNHTLADGVWRTINMSKDLSPTARSVILEYRAETGSGNTEIRIRPTGSSGEGHLLGSVRSADSSQTTIQGGQGFCAVNSAKSIEYKVVGDELVGRGLEISVVGEIKSCPSSGLVNIGFSPEMTSNQFINSLKSTLDYRIPEGAALTGLFSTFDVSARDRRWKTFYRAMTLPSGGHFGLDEIQTAFENTAQGVLDYRLPNKAIMTGLYSEFDESKSDRVWKVRYRELDIPDDRVIWGIEKLSDPVNLYKEDVDFHAPAGEVITGFFSEFDPVSGDRRWRFRTRAISFISNQESLGS